LPLNFANVFKDKKRLKNKKRKKRDQNKKRKNRFFTSMIIGKNNLHLMHST